MAANHVTGGREYLEVIETHTGGEPTRVVYAGGPDLGTGSLAERRDRFRRDYDRYRSALANEPRGSEVIVGAWLTAPNDPECVAGTLFFNNVGYLGMCGHGTIGVAVALGHLNRISQGAYRLETPVGTVSFEYDGGHQVTIENVPAECFRLDVSLDVPGYGEVLGDIAWGGNWFFLVRRPSLEIHSSRIRELSQFTQMVRRALVQAGITGRDGAAIDHVELFGRPHDDAHDSRNFVLCPGDAYDRSPCGTGTSAKLACLAARNELAPQALWRQESIVGSLFEAWYRIEGNLIVPSIRGSAYVNGISRIVLDPADPFAFGLR